ncbi:LacI family DNA-binding transcriptional regulator [Cesiribacter sp. SM1]|uniref:LacI family DNA-binding transcriptional regulator n=1 Tax=Cesiribacter sp. SM1 TaxID=2861196 RepID=UPI001CD1F128|nr:substrate-binding domain-containing protein [Cesiribacter sp. SM1]
MKEEKKKISIRDIAKQLNISVTTVSFILNGRAKEKRISDHLKEKVEKLVKEVNYKPNRLAQSLRTGKTRILGFMVEDISNPFFANIARYIEEQAYREGYKILYCSTENDREKTQELISMFRERHVDGYIITPPCGVEEDIKALLLDKLPVVLFDRYFPEINVPAVVVENKKGTYNAIKSLIEQGYKNIAFVTVESDQSQMMDRLQGYEQALREHEMLPNILKVKFHDATETIVQKIVEFIRTTDTVDALFFATNYLGVRGLEAIRREGLVMPDQIGVITFDDHDVFQLHNPSVTAVSQPIEEIARQLISNILNQLDESEGVEHPQTVVLPCVLMNRKSSIRSLP